MRYENIQQDPGIEPAPVILADGKAPAAREKVVEFALILNQPFGAR
ncbi:MAG: hypothetical protein NTZ37_05070 [Methanoregula sp.]|nr:hypothetical protein [Methanoregula sp.]